MLIARIGHDWLLIVLRCVIGLDRFVCFVFSCACWVLVEVLFRFFTPGFICSAEGMLCHEGTVATALVVADGSKTRGHTFCRPPRTSAEASLIALSTYLLPFYLVGCKQQLVCAVESPSQLFYWKMVDFGRRHRGSIAPYRSDAPPQKCGMRRQPVYFSTEGRARVCTCGNRVATF